MKKKYFHIAILLLVLNFITVQSENINCANADTTKNNDKIQKNEQTLTMLREERNFYETLLEDDVCLLEFGFPAITGPIPIAVPWKEFIKGLTIFYYRQQMSTGKEIDKNELAKRIKYLRNLSKTIKARVKLEVNRLNNEIEKTENENYRLANQINKNNQEETVTSGNVNSTNEKTGLTGTWKQDNSGQEVNFRGLDVYNGFLVKTTEKLKYVHFEKGEKTFRKLKRVPGKAGTYNGEVEWRTFNGREYTSKWEPVTLTVKGDEMTGLGTWSRVKLK